MAEAPARKAPETVAESRASTLRMASQWAALAQRLCTASAAMTDEVEQRKAATEALAQLSMTRDIVAAVLGALPEVATPRAVLAEMHAMLKDAGEMEKQRHALFCRELTSTLGYQSAALELLHKELKGASNGKTAPRAG